MIYVMRFIVLFTAILLRASSGLAARSSGTEKIGFGRTQKRRPARLSVIVAGAITVIAIVSSFASGYVGLGWQWLPAAEFLLIAELFGLIDLERHQPFELGAWHGWRVRSGQFRDSYTTAVLTDQISAGGHNGGWLNQPPLKDGLPSNPAESPRHDAIKHRGQSQLSREHRSESFELFVPTRPITRPFATLHSTSVM